ncbi:MAG: YeaC family protein [Cellvibrionaceae bacterium]
MDFQTLIENITPEIYENLKRAVELGKWPDGNKLSKEQLDHCMQAIMAYDLKNKSEEERVGFIHTKKHTHCGSDGEEDDSSEKPIKWQ